MKKKSTTLFPLLLAVGFLLFFSCHKDGVYNPKKKISRILVQYEGVPAIVAETWTWDGNLLTQIDYGYDHITRFTYDKKRVRQITDDDGWTLNFTYDGSQYDKIEEYDGSQHAGTYTFEYDGKKISAIKMVYTYPDYYKKRKENSAMRKNILNFILPENVSPHLVKLSTPHNPLSSKGTETVTLRLTWNKDNVESIALEWADLEWGYEKETCTFSYDTKRSPFQDFLFGFMEEGVGLSKNNVTRMYYAFEDPEDNYSLNYSYVYDGKYPEERRGTESYLGDAELLPTYYYEYK